MHLPGYGNKHISCNSKKIFSIYFIYPEENYSITFCKRKEKKRKKIKQANKKANIKQLPRFVLYLQQRIPSCAAIATVDVLRRAFKNPSTVCLENVTSIVTLISCVPNGSSVNVILDTN